MSTSNTTTFPRKSECNSPEVRTYLLEHFQEVKDEPSQGDYYVFGVIAHGIPREVKVHRNVFMFADLVPRYLRDHDIAQQLERGNVEIAEPLRA